MAIIEMKKLTLLGLKNEEQKILNALYKSNCVEIIKPKPTDEKGAQKAAPEDNEFTRKQSKLSLAMSIIEDCKRERNRIAKESNEKHYKKTKKPLFAYKYEVPYSQFETITSREYELLSLVEKLQAYNDELTEMKNQMSKLASVRDKIVEYYKTDVVSEFTESEHNLIMILGIVPNEFAKEFESYISGRDLIYSKIVEKNNDNLTAVVLFDKNNMDEVTENLNACRFEKTELNVYSSAEESKKQYLIAVNKLTTRRIEVLNNIINIGATTMPEFKMLYDYYGYELIKSEYSSNFHRTAYTFILEGYVPANSVEILKKNLSEVTKNIEMDIQSVEEKENPPTYVKNNKLVAPFEAVTNMYSVPSPFENDPNLFVGIFFFIFFGIIMADAGYGIILALGALFLTKKFKIGKGLRQIILVVGLGGVSTLIWGIIFGGWFGIEVLTLAEEGNRIAQIFAAPVWFSPMENPIAMLGLCLGLGVLQILFGLGLKAWSFIQKGKILDAILEVGIWYLLFAGVGCVALGLVPDFAFLSSIGIYLAIFSVAMIILTHGRHEKGIVKKLVTGVSGLVEIVQYLSDILSYSRLFGLALAGGVVAMVMNTIASMLFGSWYMIPFGIAVLLAGHLLNLALCILSAYIHNCRLQYIEFFPRFYKGGGHLFKPFGSSLKYYDIK